ncbi:hypothetical protein [Marinivivus vitaminiproducens]|uniref:hypothetical protein n=1 Tax=Marinivivus vitaminiproducens TaxID=3035935 RepID=UPI0027A5CCD2|nr:hypothetical protein P4R82_06575 [Geminicoccaceae bacterium SCSIO 64248]
MTSAIRCGCFIAAVASLALSHPASAQEQSANAPVGGAVTSGPSGTALADPTVVPDFQVDPFWPKPLPNNWLLGQVSGVAVDKRDHIWIIQRPRTLSEREAGSVLEPPISKCCTPAPPVLVFDISGNLIRHWGGDGDGYQWPANEHGIYVDDDDFVWVGGNGDHDDQILKFTLDGDFVMQIGRSGESRGNTDTENLHQPAGMIVDTEANEVYVADGYGNRRVIVFDSETGAFKRQWGAYGEQPTDGEPVTYDPSAPPARQFGSPVHCVQFSASGLVYVCDRVNDRYQVFEKDGTYVAEYFFEKQTLLNGSVSDLTFSPGDEQSYVYMVDGVNNEMRVARRDSEEVVAVFGRPGRYAGQFHVVHDIAADSQGNVYTTEVNTGQRAQKFRRMN